MKIQLEDGTVLEVEDGLNEKDIEGIIDEYEADAVSSRKAAELEASNQRRDALLAQQEANADPTTAFDRVRPRYLDGVVGEGAGRSFDSAMMGWAEQSDDIFRGFRNLFADDSEEEKLNREAEAAEQFARNTYRGSNGLAADVGDIAASVPSMFLPGGLIVQSLLGGAEAALDHEAGDSQGLDMAVGTALSGTFGKMFDLAGRLVGNAYKGWRGDGDLGGQLGETQRKAADFAEREGIETLPSQRTGHTGREQYESRVESQPYGQRFRDIRDNQEAELNRIFFQRFGIDGATEYSDTVRRAVDEKITKTFSEVKADIPTTKSDEQFLDGAVEIGTRRTLTEEQVKVIDDVAMDVADGMDAQKLLDTRKQLQEAVVGNFNKGDSVYAGALRDLVDEIDNLVERTASAETAMKYADARDMSRMRMALEMGAGTNAKGELNQTSLANRLFKIYRNELGRGRGGLRPDTQRSVDAAQTASVFKTGVGNSGTATRKAGDFTQSAIDWGIRRPIANAYLEAPYLYGSFNPIGDLAKSASYNVGRNLSGGYGDAQDFVGGLFGLDAGEDR